MNEDAYDYGIEPASDIVMSMVWGVMVLDFVSVIVVTLAVAVLYMKSKRPGTFLMLAGVLAATLLHVTVTLLDNFAYDFVFVELITWFCLLCQALSIFIACFGLLKFSRSYNNER